MRTDIEKAIDEVMESLDGAKRAEPKPFLFTRVMARVNAQSSTKNIWLRAGAFLSRPRVAFTVIMVLLLVNSMILFKTKSYNEAVATHAGSPVKDEFVINTVNLYDLENPEP